MYCSTAHTGRTRPGKLQRDVPRVALRDLRTELARLAEIVALPHALIALALRQPIGQFAPGRTGEETGLDRETVGRTGIVAIERGDRTLPFGNSDESMKLGTFATPCAPPTA
jgi:hypothetical protein